MLSAKDLKRLQKIAFKTRKLVRNSFAGAYHSIYKGKGLTFHAVRPYQYGDDVRDIDWKVTARTGSPHIKQFIEERELTVMLLIDSSASLIFGTSTTQKRDFAIELSAILAYTAVFNQDKVGILLFSETIEHYVPPRKGRNHVMRLMRDMLIFTPKYRGTNLSHALEVTNRLLPNGSVIFILSDFLAPTDSFLRHLTITSQRHNVVSVVLQDPLENFLPSVGLIGLQDLETDNVAWVDTASAEWQKQYQEESKRKRQNQDLLFTKTNVKRIDLDPNGDYIHALSLFFREQVQRLTP